MSVRFTTVHSSQDAPAAWLAYVDEERYAYVWVPALMRFALNEALTEDIAWHHRLFLRDVSPQRAREILEENRVGRVVDPSMHWVLEVLGAAPKLEVEEILPQRPVVTRAKEVERIFESLKQRPEEPLVYARYPADRDDQATRAASDLRNGRVAAFKRILPGFKPVVTASRTADDKTILIMVCAEPMSSADIRVPSTKNRAGSKRPVPNKGSGKRLRLSQTRQRTLSEEKDSQSGLEAVSHKMPVRAGSGSKGVRSSRPRMEVSR